jgi:hypothetical protein
MTAPDPQAEHAGEEAGGVLSEEFVAVLHDAMVRDQFRGAEPHPAFLSSDSDQRRTAERVAEALAPAVEQIVRAHAEADRAERLCSQCGERMSCMVKIGTDDGWCTVCLDEAAEPAAEAERDKARGALRRVEALLDEWALCLREPRRHPGWSGGAVLADLRAALAPGDES